MKLFNRLRSSPVHPIQMALFILIELQLIFGKQFTKFEVFGPVHLSDLLLFTLGIISFIYIIYKGKKIDLFWPLITMFILSVVYLIYSIITHIGPLDYIIRHYALFAYIWVSYLIFYSFIDEEKLNLNLKFFLLIGIIAVIGQLITHVYNFFTVDDYLSQLFNRFNYMTEMTMPGLVVLESWILCFIKNKRRRYFFVFLILFLSVTLGHSSAFLACFIPIVFHFMLILKIKPIIAIGTTAAFLIFFFLVLPQFSDVNALWRLLYWREILKEGVLNYYGIFGHGFGGSFITETINQDFLHELNSIHFDVNPEEKYLTPMHNSFVTIMFHIGILPGLLVFAPLKGAFHWAFTNDKLEHDKEFLILCFIGFAVWASLNVVLELPHCSAFFWLIYFSLIYKFKPESIKSFRLSLRPNKG